LPPRRCDDGKPPLILDLEAVRDDDHVVAVYRTNGHWALSQIKLLPACRFRCPVYRRSGTALSYSSTTTIWREKVRAYSRAGEPGTIDRSIDDVGIPLWPIPEYLVEIKHTAIFEPTKRMYMDERLYKAGLVAGRNRAVE